MRMASLVFSVFWCGLTVLAGAQEEPPELPSGREPSEVMSYHGADWLERPGRVDEEQPYKVIETMGLEDGDVCVDMGCGTGFFGRKMAKAVAPSGKVYGVDIQPEMLELLEQYCEEEGIENVEPVLGTHTDPKLPEGAIDWMILVDVYHEFQEPMAMLAEMRKALKPDGRIALLEYRLKGESAAHIKKSHRMSVEQVKQEWLPAGFELVELHEFLPSQHFFIFKKAEEGETESADESE